MESKILLYISILCALFLNTDAAAYLGVGMLTTAAFTPILLYVFFRYFKGKFRIVTIDSKYSIVILIVSLTILLVKYFIGQDFFKILLNFSLIPVFISLAFSKISLQEKKIFSNSVLFFYIVECTLAIIERILQKRFFDTIYVSDRYDYLSFEQYGWEFRSTSLLGHPLENGMAVAIIMGFILFSSFSFYKKTAYFFLGFVSLFCFNARGAIMVTAIFLVPFLIKEMRSYYKKWRSEATFIYLCLISLILYKVATSELGGRLFNNDKIMDDSALTRIDVFSYLTYLPEEKIIFGDIDNYSRLLVKLSIIGVENGLIVAILLYGILAIPLLLSLFLFQWNKLSVYKKTFRLAILMNFWVLGFMNPNLVDPNQWFIFIFSYYAFRPENNVFNFNKTKYS